MFPLIATVWMVSWLIVLVSNSGSYDGSAVLLAWIIIGIFPPVFYKLMSM